tara:strand:+ start:103 stop:453 length:351 start_codon:yes stop_codon:yes gene_type:complete
MYITESKLRSVIRNELILEEISGTKKLTLQTLLLSLLPLIMSPNNPESAGDQFMSTEIPKITKAIEMRGLDPANPEDADQIQILILHSMRGGLEGALEKHLPKRNKEIDVSSIMKR